MTVSPLTLIGAAAAGSAAARSVGRLVGQAGAFSELLAPALGTTSAEEPAPAMEGPGTSDVRQVAEQAMADFREQLRQLLDDQGLSTTLRFQLVDDGQGGIRILGDHPQRRRLEQAINADPQLLASFQYLAASYSLLAAAERHAELTERYLGDPVLGAAEIARFTGGDKRPFTLNVNGEQISADVHAAMET